MPGDPQTVESDPVRYDRIGDHVALVTLNRPQKRNAINAAVTEALERIVRATEADREIRAVILTSCDDRVFCAGADLATVASGGGKAIETADGGFAGLVYAKRLKPWIAAVEGMALAGGCEICLACDMIVASENARFALPEVKRGLVAGGGGVHRLPAVLPRNVALEMIATGEPLDAARAYACGLVNRLTKPGETLAAARALADAIAANAPVAVQQSLVAARRAGGLSEAEARVIVAEAVAKACQSEDYREGPRAFLEKRAPVWKG